MVGYDRQDEEGVTQHVPGTGNLVEMRDVRKTYKMGEVEVQALHVAELDIKCGEFVAILGPSGSGKTTLLNLIGGIDAPTSGSILFDGEDISTLNSKQLTLFRRENVGFVFQFFNLIPTLTAEENVRFAIDLASRDGVPPERDAKVLLAEVGLADRATHFPKQLSGGEQQRVAVASALGKGAEAHPGRRTDRQPRLPHRQARALRAAQGEPRGGRRGRAGHPQPASRRDRRPGAAAAGRRHRRAARQREPARPGRRELVERPMSMLALKMLRDTLAHKGQFIALIVLVSLGIMSFVTFQNGYYDLRASVDEAYGRLRFADFTVRVDRMPLSAAEAIERLDGVEAARVRTIQDVGIEFEGGGRQATARIITVPDEPESRVNGVYVEAGRYPAAGARNEVLLHPKFSQETGIGVNDTLTLRIGGERRECQGRWHRFGSRVPLPAAHRGRHPVAWRVRSGLRHRGRRRVASRHAATTATTSPYAWRRAPPSTSLSRLSSDDLQAVRRHRQRAPRRAAQLRRLEVRAGPEPRHGPLPAGAGAADQLDVAVHRALAARDGTARRDRTRQGARLQRRPDPAATT